jgi:hypothetical protein
MRRSESLHIASGILHPVGLIDNCYCLYAMRKTVFIFLMLVLTPMLNAQVAFKTVTKDGPVVVGESFQVQYVLEDIDKASDFSPPEFKNFRFINGPFIYDGSAYGTDGLKKMKNFVYTLEAIKPGRFLIAGASARMDDRLIRSDDVWLQVISKTEAARRGLQADNAQQNATWLRPGEDPYEKMRKNLYLKVMVDKHTCFVGEPVTATFKLYSRLASLSDIVKNPGFYGFTVQDMVNLDDKQFAVETINGKKFNVHTIRKVQLYPLQAGTFNIDPMEVNNEVKFSRSAVYKETEQEIVEGVFPDADSKVGVNEEKYENRMSTPEISIIVKPAPAKGRPDDFTGATGRFSINTSVNKKELAKNEQGLLLVTISGKGNFTQLSQPVVEWPAGIEGFEPQIVDSLVDTQSPLRGSRTFKFGFVAARPGQYTIPSVSLSFFNPDSNGYKTVSTQSVSVTINEKEKNPGVVSVMPGKKDSQSIDSWFLLLLVGFFVLSGVGVWFLWFRKKEKANLPALVVTQPTLPSLSEILMPASVVVMADDQLFYTTLRNSIWEFFTLYYGFTGSKMNRRELLSVMQQRKADLASQATIVEILEQCETGIFTGVLMNADKDEMLAKTREALEKLV